MNKKFISDLVEFVYSLRLWKNTNKDTFCIANTVPDTPDENDYIVSSEDKELPDYVMLPLPEPRNQGATNSCASHAVILAQEILLIQEERYLEGSERYHYYNARKYVMGNYPENVGMSLRDACKTTQKYGMALEEACPWSVAKVNEKPSIAAYWLSSLYQIDSYFKLFTIEDIKKAIAGGFPVVCGVWLDNEYYNLNEKNWQWSPKVKGNKGGHAQTIVGYDNIEEVLFIRNSWGPKWGNYALYKIKFSDFLKVSFDYWQLIPKRWD